MNDAPDTPGDDPAADPVAGSASGPGPDPNRSTDDGPIDEPDPKLLEILVCPVTRGVLDYDRERQELVSRSARLAYPIRDGIPIMLPEEARPIEDDDAP